MSVRILHLVILAGLVPTVLAQEPPMLRSDPWTIDTVLTVGETYTGHQAPGLLDGIAAYHTATPGRVRLLVNHELGASAGPPYSLSNGTSLTGARVSEFVVERVGCVTNVISAGLAYDAVFDRAGTAVTTAAQINETGSANDGLSRFNSARGYLSGELGFVDELFFTTEEVFKPVHPHGGTHWVLDVAQRQLHAAPMLGRGSWENVAALDSGDPTRVALLMTEDFPGAPLFLWVGEKNAIGNGSLLDRNGLAQGQMYVWSTSNGDLSPQDFNGSGNVRAGTFLPISVCDPAMAGQGGHDAAGFLDDDTLRGLAQSMGAFSFSRTEDIHADPNDPTRAVFASTGFGAVFPADNWGTLYVVDVDFSNLPAVTGSVSILHDADELAVPDDGIRNPDNVAWARDGLVYVQEDRAVNPSGLFGAVNGIECSIWAIDPSTGGRGRVAVIDRSVVRPVSSDDFAIGDLGHWETSGVLDVSEVFGTREGDRLLIATVQAHGIQNGAIASDGLVEGGQLVLLERRGVMLRGDSATTMNGWRSDAVFTVGDDLGGYTPPGLLDGIGAFPGANPDEAVVVVNHEISRGSGYPYALANGTTLTGTRVSRLVVRKTDCTAEVVSAGLAYDTIFDRQGNVVTSAAQVNETGHPSDGMSRFCSGQHVRAGTFDFVDDLFFCGEETSVPAHPHGGTEWVLDVAAGELHAVPMVGRGSWENASPVDTGNPNTVALVLGDDFPGAPLYLWVGVKNGGSGGFLDRNGLEIGQVYVWIADAGDLDPSTFNGVGATRTGRFLPITVRDLAMMGAPGYDADGYLDDFVLRALADQLQAFSFSRPEDVHANPADGSQIVLASTGRGSLFPADNWGTVYLVDFDFAGPGITADLTILHDADGLPDPDAGIRSPDNLTWAHDGMIYVQEDRSTALFGMSTGIESSVWRLDPATTETLRIAMVDRFTVLPLDATDAFPADIGNWETSGILDVSDLFTTDPGEVLLLANVQAHGIGGGSIGGGTSLVQGGQMVMLSRRRLAHDVRCNALTTSNELRFEISNGTPGGLYFLAFTAQAPGAAPNGAFFGITITSAELGVLIAPPFLDLLDPRGRASFAFDIGAIPCPLGASIDCVALEAAGGILRVSLASTIDI